jgi:hypothetical protein
MKNELLAPNGMPSNLTPEQYKLVRTPAFLNWFGDWENDPEKSSKVVDENGEPLVVYHRTKLKFYEFNSDSNLIGWLGRGFYFSPNKNEFKEYGRSVLTCFLNVKKIFISKGGDSGDLFSEVKSINKSNFFNENDIAQTLKENGYNGVLLKHWDRGIIITCFEPNQIKLADGTNVAFDSKNNDIRFDKGGLISPNGMPSNLTPEQYKLVRTPAFLNWFGNWINDPENASKVIDGNGEPLVVYHSSNNDFNTFKKDTIGSNFEYSFGFHFSNDVEDSKKYGEKTKSVFLNLRNPKIFNVNDKINGSVFIDTNRYDAIHDIVDSRKDKLNEIDGVIAYSNTNGYVVMYSNQIKLADGTNTTFDDSNPDIRFEQGGKTKNGTPEYLKMFLGK